MKPTMYSPCYRNSNGPKKESSSQFTERCLDIFGIFFFFRIAHTQPCNSPEWQACSSASFMGHHIASMF
uniref:Uncharacterized protein n=1 Tax=Rhizophora mucronata TaxID=61149 RepID=A0A2P2IZP5_RHIMU